MRTRDLISFLAVVTPLAIVLSARAQTDAPAPSPAASTSASIEASAVAPSAVPVTVTTPAPPPAPAPAPKPVVAEPVHASEVVDVAPEKKPVTDHDKVVGRLGIGYFGQFDVPLGFTAARRDGPTEPAQLLGVRYWWSRVRLDISIGINVGAGSQTVRDTKTDQVSTLVWVGRVGLPFALYVDDHYTFFLGPEVAYGRAGETVPAPQPTAPGSTPIADTTHTGSRFSVGARAGAEVQFGFIGIPRLALDATVGLALDLTGGSTEGPDPTVPPVPGQPIATTKSDYTRTAFRSSTAHQPWNIFISNVAAVYYF